MTDWSEFWRMGGYAAYVWSAYGIAAVVLALNLFAPIARERRLRRMLQRQYQREQARS